MTQADVRSFLLSHLAERVRAEGRPEFPDDIPDDYDLLLSGLIDSLGLLELVSALSAYCGRELDFEAIDPDDLTRVGPLSRFVAEQVAKL
jgi:acyl carrier protein